MSEVRGEMLASLIRDMRETMKKEKGVGLAAPQIGVNKRLILVETEQGIEVFINPKIVSSSKAMVESEEGCLSVPKVYGMVRRHKKIKLKALKEDGTPVRLTATGLPAIIFQHEIDHLDGVLFIDKVEKIYKRIRQNIRVIGYG
jgi:peptide deformylase